MYDAVDANDVPNDGRFDLLAGYVDGLYRSYVPLQHRFPGFTVVSIDVLNHPGTGQVLDIEKGDATPAEAPAWFDASVRAGIVRPTLYYSTSDHLEIVRLMGSRKFDNWVASYGVSQPRDNNGNVIHPTAWQKIDHGPNGENIDISEVYDPFWPFAPRTEEEEDDMQLEGNKYGVLPLKGKPGRVLIAADQHDGDGIEILVAIGRGDGEQDGPVTTGYPKQMVLRRGCVAIALTNETWVKVKNLNAGEYSVGVTADYS